MPNTLPDPKKVASRWLSAGIRKEARALRIYEYTDNRGVVFWSFSRIPFNSTRRLDLADVRGTYFRSHISDIQSMAFQMELIGDE